jgi:hypothetical protein
MHRFFLRDKVTVRLTTLFFNEELKDKKCRLTSTSLKVYMEW